MGKLAGHRPLPQDEGEEDGWSHDEEREEEDLGGLEDQPTPHSLATSWPVLFAATISSLTAATLGYDVGIMADAIELIEDSFDLDHLKAQVIVGSLNFIAAFGTLIAGQTSDIFGRKSTVALCCVLYIVGTALMAFAPTYLVLVLGRIVTGLGVGVAFVVTPVYITEITPSEVRGMLTTCFDVSINLGILFGYITGFVITVTDMSSEAKWRTMLGLGGVIPLIVAAALSKLPESPRWLMTRGKEDEASAVLLEFLGDEEVTQSTITDIRSAIEQENACKSLSWQEFFFPKESYLRKITLLVIGLGFWQQATGSEAVLYYSATFLKNAGLDSMRKRLLGYIGVGLCKLIPEVMVMCIVDKFGRRPLLVLSSIGVTITIFSLAVTFVFDRGEVDDDDAVVLNASNTDPPHGRLLAAADGSIPSSTSSVLVVLLLCFYMCLFSFGMGPVTWLTASESMPLRQRAKGMTSCCFVNRLVSGIVALTTLSTCDALGGPSGFFFFYGSVSVVGTMWYMRYVPETMGKSLEAITAENKAMHAGEEGDQEPAEVVAPWFSTITGSSPKTDMGEGEGTEW